MKKQYAIINTYFKSKAILALVKNSISKILRYQIINSNLSLLIKKNQRKGVLRIEKYEFTYKDYLNYYDSLYCHTLEEILCVREESTPYTLDENKKKTGDIVYKIKGEEIFFLVEHQTKVDYSMPYRILNYCVEIIRRAVEEHKLNKATYKYPKVVPIVLYTGNAKWKASNSFAMSQIYKEGYEDEIIDLSYKLIDVNKYEIEALLQCKTLY